MKSYEVICVFHPELKEEKIDSIISKIEGKVRSSKGEVQKVDKWGIKKLAFSPKKSKGVKEGYYVAIYFKSESTVPSSVRDLLRVTEGVVRYLITVSKGRPLEEFAAGPEEEKVEISPSMLEESQG